MTPSKAICRACEDVAGAAIKGTFKRGCYTKFRRLYTSCIRGGGSIQGAVHNAMTSIIQEKGNSHAKQVESESDPVDIAQDDGIDAVAMPSSWGTVCRNSLCMT